MWWSLPGRGWRFRSLWRPKLFRAKTLYIECYDRPTLPTMTGKMLYVLADDFNVQSDEQQKNFPDSRVIHPIF